MYTVAGVHTAMVCTNRTDNYGKVRSLAICYVNDAKHFVVEKVVFEIF